MKKLLIISGVLVIVIAALVLGIGMFLGNKPEITEVLPTPTIALPTVSDNISVDLTPKDNNRAVLLKIAGLTSDIESIQYELTYTTGNGLPRGVLGKITVSGEKEIIRDDIVLGTCSSGRCVYDTGVTEITLSLKFNSTFGPRVFQKTYILS